MAKATSQFVNCVNQLVYELMLDMTYKIQTLRNAICRRSRLNRLDFACVDFADNSPCGAVG